MKRNRRRSLKAVFLLVVFFLNTAVGFACSLNADLIFNAHHSDAHHHQQSNDHFHKHDHAKPHHHKAILSSEAYHASELPDECQSTEQVGLGNQHSEKAHKDNCCSDEVLKLEKTDKLIDASTGSIVPFNGVHAIFYAAFYDFRIFELRAGNSNSTYLVHHYHPPIPDIRIAIQSFQI